MYVYFFLFPFLFLPFTKVIHGHLIFVKLKLHEIYEICAVREAPDTGYRQNMDHQGSMDPSFFLNKCERKTRRNKNAKHEINRTINMI